MIASFSRALLEDLRHQMTAEEFDAALASAIDEIHAASATEGQDHLNPPSRFEAILFSARRQSAGLVVLSQALPTVQWTAWVKSEGRQNGFDIETKCLCRQNNCLRRTFSFDIFAILTPRRWI
jgi:hypothetical protein